MGRKNERANGSAPHMPSFGGSNSHIELIVRQTPTRELRVAGQVLSEAFTRTGSALVGAVLDLVDNTVARRTI